MDVNDTPPAGRKKESESTNPNKNVEAKSARQRHRQEVQDLETAHREQINELQVEAGPRLCGALFEAGLVDELLLYVAPVLLGDSARPLLSLPPLENMMQRRALRVIDQRRVGGDMRMLLRPAQEIA